YDLHVLSAPPAFVLSQDQTLHQVSTLSETRFAPQTNKLLPTCSEFTLLPLSDPRGRDTAKAIGDAPQSLFPLAPRPVLSIPSDGEPLRPSLHDATPVRPGNPAPHPRASRGALQPNTPIPQRSTPGWR